MHALIAKLHVLMKHQENAYLEFKEAKSNFDSSAIWCNSVQFPIRWVN